MPHPKLFTPLQLGGITLPNRIVVSPMCQYSADDGSMTDWHLIHLGQLAYSGAGLLVVEATGVTREGRITHGCTGLYSDDNEAAMSRVIQACRRLSQHPIGIQLAHAGRKASVQRPLEGRQAARRRRIALADRGAFADPLRRGLACAARARQRGNAEAGRAFRRRRVAREAHRLRRGRAAFGARLPAAPVPFAAVQPAHRLAMRKNRMQFPARSRARGARHLAEGARARRAHQRQRLDGRRPRPGRRGRLREGARSASASTTCACRAARCAAGEDAGRAGLPGAVLLHT